MASTVVWSISSPEVRLAKIIFLSARVMNLIKNQQITTSTPARYKGETAENINDPVCSLAILAAKAGANFVSPFVGRLDDIGEKGMNLIEDIVVIYENYGFETEVLVASVRSIQHVIDAALIGAQVATVPPKIIHELYKHQLTDKGLKAFLDDWAKTGQSILPK